MQEKNWIEATHSKCIVISDGRRKVKTTRSNQLIISVSGSKGATILTDEEHEVLERVFKRALNGG